ncbi:MAG: restriction endonuclease subunit S, partial [Sulfurovum sp.]|nr:restriction endonuclease subunit S [Sulfurovum sp.]
MNRFKKYESYKESGLEWLGKIPSEWGVKRVKDTFRYFGSGSTPLSTNMKYYDDGIIPWLNTTDIKNTIVNNTKYKVTQLAKDDYSLKIYPINSLAIGMYGQGQTRGSVALLNIKVATNQNAGIMYKFTKSNSKFIFWWFIGRKTHIRQIGNMATIPNLNKDIVRNLFISLPPLKTQTKIANYLDTQTQKIDKEIKLLEEKSLKYKELKQTLINETVSRGVDKGIKFETKRLKDFIVYTIGGEVIDVGYWDRGSELTYTAGKNPVLSDFDTFPDRKRTTKNDILIARNGDGFVHIPKLNSIFTNVVQLVRLSKKVDINFIWYCLEDIKFNINRISNGDFIASLNKEMWFNSFLNIPPLKDQIKIAS